MSEGTHMTEPDKQQDKDKPKPCPMCRKPHKGPSPGCPGPG